MESKHFFSILTPTYKRPEMLQRAIESVVMQSYPHWEMIVINDDPDSLNLIQTTIRTDNRIRVFTNDTNLGANGSRNRALSLTSPKSTRVIFLDDDDYLVSNALIQLTEFLDKYPNQAWLMTNRVLAGGTSLTQAPKSEKVYNYGKDYLLGRKITGDATHCIKTLIATSARFPTRIKNGEEWLYFLEISQYTPLFYINTPSTMSDGYLETGLNFRLRSTFEQLHTVRVFLQEGRGRGRMTWSIVFWAYLTMRILRAFIKRA